TGHAPGRPARYRRHPSGQCGGSGVDAVMAAVPVATAWRRDASPSRLYNPLMDIFSLHRGSAPLLVSLPHDGVFVPGDIAARLTPQSRRVPATDEHSPRPYDFATHLVASYLGPLH